MKRKIFYVLSLLLCSVYGVNTQTTQTSNWVKLESDTKDFSIAIPSNYQVLQDEKGSEAYYGSFGNLRKIKFSNIRRITAFENNASFLVESYKVVNLTDSLASLNEEVSASQQTADINFNDFKGKLFMRENADSYSIELIIGSKDRAYRIFGGARDRNNEMLAYFLASLKLNDKNFINSSQALKVQIKETPMPISSLKETEFLVEKEKKEDSEKIESNNKSQAESNVKKLIILFKPRPHYTQEARNSKTQGKASLRVTFSENGNIEKITVVSGLSDELTDAAVKAARLIRFLPLEIDNKPTSTKKIVEYSFSIY